MATFAECRAGYAELWRTMEPNPSRAGTVRIAAQKLIAQKATYERVERATGVPWFVVALIDQMEGGGTCSTHLHNGDPLTRRTVNVPAGRPPPPSNPPFTFYESCLDALHYDGLDKINDWSLERIAYELERFNGFGYRRTSVNIPTPYLWSGCNHYARGKYVSDGVYDAHAVSGQIGAMPILRTMMLLDPSIVIGAPTPIPKPTPKPIPKPVPKPAPPPAHVGVVAALGLLLAALAHWFGAHPVIIAILLAAVFAVVMVWLQHRKKP